MGFPTTNRTKRISRPLVVAGRNTTHVVFYVVCDGFFARGTFFPKFAVNFVHPLIVLQNLALVDFVSYFFAGCAGLTPTHWVGVGATILGLPSKIFPPPQASNRGGSLLRLVPVLLNKKQFNGGSKDGSEQGAPSGVFCYRTGFDIERGPINR